MNYRVGIGYDAHRLVEGRDLILGGVTIPHHLGLEGHSDADVLLHAITDALLGAAALGDIGAHFPDNDPRYKQADSLVLLQKSVKLIEQKGFKTVNVDATVIAEKPKLQKYIKEMRQNIAGCLGCNVDRVSVKATTNEKMGFTGTEKGIAVHAVAMLEKRG